MIVRADLPKGVQAAQIIHAAGESSPGKLSAGTFAFALAVPNEAALAAEAKRLADRGFARVEPGAAGPPPPPRVRWFDRLLRWLGWKPHEPPAVPALGFVEVREPDAPYANALMAIGLVPARREVLRRHVSSLPTLK